MPYYEDPQDDAPWLTGPQLGTTTPDEGDGSRPSPPPDREGYSWFWDDTAKHYYEVPITPAPAAETTTTSGGGGGMTEAEGRAYDAERGLTGGYMGPNGWVSGSPSGGGGGDFGGGGGGGGGDYGSFDSSGFAWPQFNAPNYTQGPAFQAPPAFSYEAFKAPGFNEIFSDPSYTGRRDEGLQAIEHGAAARGLTRLPNTLKALAGWNQDFASREYGNIFDRSANTWNMNRNNAADTYSTNYGISRDVWDRGEGQNRFKFDQDYRGAKDAFDMNAFQPSKLTFEDMYRRWRDELDSTTRIATAGADGY
jgi:hypothetical protein